VCAEKPGAERGFRLLYFLPYICNMAKRIRPGITFDISAAICFTGPLVALDGFQNPLPFADIIVLLPLVCVVGILAEAFASLFYRKPYTPMEPEDHLILTV
jgi:hypothetical protein